MTSTNPFDTAYPSQPEMTEGMTKRELMAMHIYAAITNKSAASSRTVATEAVQQADALIAALNKPLSTSFTGPH